MEEDTGKLLHQGSQTLIDFNRSGVPLVEIVTAPDFTDSGTSGEFLKEIQAIVRALGISTADMEKGSLRLEANISVRKSGQTALPSYKVEIKNVNSFKFVKKAIDYEVTRQIQLLESGQTPIQETRGFNESLGKTISQRSKEEAHDYRYFPEPDIPPLQFTSEQIEKWRNELPKLPAQIRQELITKYNLSSQYAGIIANDREMHAAFTKNPSISLADSLVNKRPPKSDNPLPAPEKLKEVTQKVIAANPKAVADFKSGKQQAMFHLIGQIKKELGEIDVPSTQKIIEELLNTYGQ
mgnify:CR=1 FL=1